MLHRGRAFEARDLASLAAGSDPMAAIGQKLGAYLANQQQADLLKSLEGVFGALTGGDSPAFSALRFDTSGATALGPRQVAKARAILGDQGDKLSVVAMHSACYYDLVERKAIDYVLASEISSGLTGDATQSVFAGSVAAAFGDVRVPTFMGMRVVVSDDITNSGGNYACYFFTPGAVASGEQAALRTETDRDILAKSDAMSVDMHYIYHPVGAKWAVTDANPNRSALATVGNWSKVYETKNIGIVRATITSNYD